MRRQWQLLYYSFGNEASDHAIPARHDPWREIREYENDHYALQSLDSSSTQLAVQPPTPNERQYARLQLFSRCAAFGWHIRRAGPREWLEEAGAANLVREQLGAEQRPHLSRQPSVIYPRLAQELDLRRGTDQLPLARSAARTAAEQRAQELAPL